MPWKIETVEGEFCVFKKDTNEKLKCYPNKKEAEDYLAALYANAPEGEKSLEGATEEVGDPAVKVGSRHSKIDQDDIQEIHDRALKLGAKSPPAPVVSEITTFPLGNYDTDKAMVYFGDAVKALGDGKVGGYLVRFSTDNDPDLTGEFFSKDTDFGDLATGTVYYQHGLDEKLKRRKLGNSTHRTDEFGVWAETQLAMRDEYEKFIYELAESGKLGWSSGTASHLVEKEQSGKAFKITRWPLGLDDTLTPTPAEPRNSAIPLKSYLGAIKQPTLENHAEDVGATSQVDGGAEKSNIPNMESKTMEITQEQLDTMVAEAGRKGADAAIKSLPTVNQAGVQVIQDEADKPFESMGKQLEAVKIATLSQGRQTDPRLNRLTLKSLGANELVGSEGGFLLEPSFVAGLLAPLHDTGPFSSRANKLPIGPNANGVTVRAIDETSRADGSRWGGIKGYRLAEGGTKLATHPAFRLMELRLKKYAVLCYATDELLQDTTALAGIISQGCAEELDFMVNDDILNGLGAGGPLGILQSGALVTVTKEGGQLADTVVTQNIFKMWARMHPRSKGNSVWFINTDVMPQLYGLNLTVGTGGMPMFMAPGSLPNAPSGSLLGRPVIETEFNPTVGDAGDVCLFDMSQYALIDRDVQAASSIHVQFIVDETAFRFVYRVDGQPKIAAPLTPYKGAGTLSPFVALGARV